MSSTRPTSTRSYRPRSPLPGFNLTLGYTVFYLCLIVLIPLAGVFIKATELGAAELLGIIGSERVQNALALSFGTALAAALLNSVFGMLVAWVFVRYEFPGKRLFDAMIDLPFALPTAVAGIALTAPALDIPESDWDSVIATDLKGAWLVAQSAARHMVRLNHGGAIINIGSIFGLQAAAQVPAVCTVPSAR